MTKKPINWNPEETLLDEFKKNFPVAQVIDTYKEQLEELFLIRNPKFRFDKNYQADFKKFLESHLSDKDIKDVGAWFYFPWNKYLVHYLSRDMHWELRTARNRDLITKEEQEKFYNFKIGIGGLSVGSHVALTIAMMGGGRLMKLADPDEISGSNLNRIRLDFTRVGIKKTDSVIESIYQLDPFSELHDYPTGVTVDNISDFAQGLDILVDELDNFEMKIRLRLEAKKRKLPLIMATDNGDNIIFDIERYDLDKDLKLFNGAIGDFGLDDLKTTPPTEFPKIATKIAGPEFAVPRMLGSVMEVGKTLYSWPQLGDAATLCGAASAYVIRKIALGEKIKTGKLEVSLDKVFRTEDFLNEEKIKRQEYLKTMGLS